MNYYEEAIRTKQLNGKTCFISRVKEKGMVDNFSTLHSLVYKVLKQSNNYPNKEDLNKKLTGGLMKKNIKQAALNTIGESLSDKQILDYYYSIRNYQNTGEEGDCLLNNYKKIKGDTMDWEESMQLATWYLNEDIVDSIDSFDFDNIVLLHPELLGQKRNKNALDLFLALCQWSIRHTNWNIYYVTQNGECCLYLKGSDQILKNTHPIKSFSLMG